MHKKIFLNFLNLQKSAQGYPAIICPFDPSFLDNVFFNYSEATRDADSGNMFESVHFWSLKSIKNI